MITLNGNDPYPFASLIECAKQILAKHGIDIESVNDRIVRGDQNRDSKFARDIMQIAQKMTDKIIDDSITANNSFVNRWEENHGIEWYQIIPGVSAAQGVSSINLAVCSCAFLGFEQEPRILNGVGFPMPGSVPYGTVEVWCPDLWQRHLFPIIADSKRGAKTGILIVDALGIVCRLVRDMPEDLTYLLEEFQDYVLETEAELEGEDE